MIDFAKWNEQYGGQEALEALEEAKKNEFTEVPDGRYITKLEKLELAESKSGKPMVKGQFRITEGQHKKQCIFYNQVFCRSASGSGFPIHNGLEFLRSLNIFETDEIDFDGDYVDFNDLLLDMAEAAAQMTFEITKSHDGDYTRLTVNDAY